MASQVSESSQKIQINFLDKAPEFNDACNNLVQHFIQVVVENEKLSLEFSKDQAIMRLRFKASLELFDSEAMATRDKIKAKLIQKSSEHYNIAINSLYRKILELGEKGLSEDSTLGEADKKIAIIEKGTEEVLTRIRAQMVEWGGYQRGL